MIEYLKGRLLRKHSAGVVLDVNGVGYGLNLPLKALMKTPRVGEELALWVYTKVREDAITLFGFLTPEDRLGFEFLLQVSGVGPKAALAVFSQISYEDFVDILRFRQVERLQSVQGLGKKTAEKIVFELEGKVDRLVAASMGSVSLRSKPVGTLGLEEATASTQRAVLSDLASALENLGYKDRDIKPILDKMTHKTHLEDFSDLLRESLRVLTANAQESKRKSEPSRLF